MTEHEEMPLILDNPMGEATMQVDLDDVDDLFGDGVNLSLTPRRPSKKLQARLDELRSRGCCQGLAWGKTGTIASIVPGGECIELRYLHADPENGTWGLSEPTPLNPWPGLPGGPIVHLTWSPTQTSSELVAIDSVGRVLMFGFSNNLNRPSVSRKWESDPVDDLHTVVGTYWLHIPGNQQRINPYYMPATRNANGSGYMYSPSTVHSNPPFHPSPARSSLVCITANGLLKLFWTQNTGKVEETTFELESVDSADDLITHAAACGDTQTKSMFVAMATKSGHLRLAQVGLNWGLPKETPPNMPPTALQITPQLIQRHYAATTWLPQSRGDSHLESSMTQISHIEVLPYVHRTSQKVSGNPVIVTVRSFIPGPTSPYEQEVQSIIDRWEVIRDQSQGLSSAFEQLGTRRNSIGSAPPSAARLKRLDPIVVNKIVTGIQSVSLGKVVSFSYSDGSVEYRDRDTMAELYTESNLEQVTSILETGFTQPGEHSCLQTALSPTTFSLAQMAEDGKIKWHSVTCQSPDITLSDDAAMTMWTAQSVYTGANIDDILAVARNFAQDERFVTQWINEMVTLLRMTVDYSEDAPHDHLFRNNQLQHCFSVLNHLGWNGDYKPRHFRSKLSVIALNLRNIVILITIANNSQTMQRSTTPMDDPDVVNSLAGCCKWSIDLLGWLCDSLFLLLNDSKFMTIVANKAQFSQMNDYLTGKNEVALHLVLCSSIRGLLQAVCRRISLLDGMSQRAIHHYERNGPSGGDASGGNSNGPPGSRAGGYGSPLHMAYQRIHRYTSSSLVNVKDFETLLTTLGAEIRAAYKPNKPPNNQSQQQNNKQQQQQQQVDDPSLARMRQHSELNLLQGHSPPNIFQDVVHKFFNVQLREFREKTDPAELFFANYELLEIDDSPQALAKRKAKGMHVDMFKRVEISRLGKGGAGGGGGNHSSSNKGGQQQQQMGAGGGAPGSKEMSSSAVAGATQSPPWRRCVRCANVMEDFGTHSNKPNLAYVLSQQRNCCCGGRMALLS